MHNELFLLDAYHFKSITFTTRVFYTVVLLLFKVRSTSSTTDIFPQLLLLKNVSPFATFTLKCVKPVLNLQSSEHCTLLVAVHLMRHCLCGL